MTRRLHISADLQLPVDAVTETFGILAMRGAGKTNAGRVFAEELFAAGAPFVAVDPVGSWWGLRAGRDGKPGGIAVPIFGGKHGDVPLERGGGAVVADLVVDENVSCVLDLSKFDSEAAKKQFLLAFAQRLYQRNETPRQLILEECDDYIPQRPQRDELQLLRAWENIVRRGRARGLGMTLITQRSAVVAKNVLTQVGTLITLRTTSPQDRAAIEAWIQHHGQKDDILASLPKLANGEAWVWSPQFLQQTVRIQFRPSTTFDSGATPKLGKSKQKAPATLADVDLGALQERMAATIERAKGEDPKHLQSEVARLRRELASAAAAPAKVERVEVPVLQDAQIARLETLGAQVIEASTAFALAARELAAVAGAAIPPVRLPSANGVHRRAVASASPAPARVARAEPQEQVRSAARFGSLGKCERSILAVLAQHESAGIAKIALLTGYRANGGGFRNALGSLRTAGLIQGGNGEDLQLTLQGTAATREVEPLPTGQALLEHWKARFGLCERKVIEALVDSPGGMPLAELAAATGYAAGGGGFRNALGALRTAGVIVGGNGHVMQLSAELLDAIGGGA